MTCEIKDARLCRKCSVVTAEKECDLCGKRTMPHPESASPDAAQYCLDCGEEFTAAEVIVRTFRDDPYCQCEDGELITVCRECEQFRIQEEGDAPTHSEPTAAEGSDVPNEKVQAFILEVLGDYKAHDWDDVMVEVDEQFEKAGMKLGMRQSEQSLAGLIDRAEVLQRWSGDFCTLKRVRKQVARVEQRALFVD